MGFGSMGPIGAKIHGAIFPVHGYHPLLWRPQNLHALRCTVEIKVHVPRGITKIILQGRACGVQTAKDKPLPLIDLAYGYEPPLGKIHFAFVEVFTMRCSHKLTFGVKSPAVIWTDKLLAVSGFTSTQQNTAMCAKVGKGANFTIITPDNNHWIVGHLAQDIIARIGDFRLVRQIEPSFGKDALHFQAPDFFAIENTISRKTLVLKNEIVYLHEFSSLETYNEYPFPKDMLR